MSFLLDTDICIYLLTGNQPDKRASILTRQPTGRMVLSTITLSELRYGAAKSKWRKANIAALERFILDFEIESYGETAARAYGEIRAHLERKGNPIGPLDMLLAAHALGLDATLVTHNTREFSRVPGLEIADWTLPA